MSAICVDGEKTVAVLVKGEGVRRGGETQGVKRRVKLKAGGGGAALFQVRDEEECWMALYRTEWVQE